VPASVVSIWDVEAGADAQQKPVLSATPRHLLVGVPLGLKLAQLVTFHAPFLNAVRITPGLLAPGLLSDMPYVGEVDLNRNSDVSNVAMTATGGGFVVRGTVSGTWVTAKAWQQLAGWRVVHCWSTMHCCGTSTCIPTAKVVT
jgi:hypothetical protein